MFFSGGTLADEVIYLVFARLSVSCVCVCMCVCDLDGYKTSANMIYMRIGGVGLGWRTHSFMFFSVQPLTMTPQESAEHIGDGGGGGGGGTHFFGITAWQR